MKILVLSDLFPNEIQYRGSFVKFQIEDLTDKFDIKVLSMVPKDFGLLGKKYKNLPLIVKNKNYEIFQYKELKFPRPFDQCGRLFLYPYFVKKYLTEIKKTFDFDLIHAYFLFPDAYTAACLKKFFQTPVITTVLGDDIRIFPKKFFLKKAVHTALNESDKVIADSLDVKEKLLEYGVKPDKIELVYFGLQENNYENSFEVNIFNKYFESGKNVLFIGQLIDRKNVEMIVESVHELINEKNHINLLMIGSGLLQGKLKKYIEINNLETRIKILSSVSENDKIEFLSSCDTLILPSKYEAYGVVLVEAMLSGKPVIGANIGGMKEVVIDNKTGYLIELNNKIDLKNKLLKLLNSNWDSTYIRDYAKKFTIRVSSEKLSEIYKQVNYEFNS
jgi:glycosyltransferase involved in cell wall biosynthesis